jgi:hypothetical protein
VSTQKVGNTRAHDRQYAGEWLSRMMKRVRRMQPRRGRWYHKCHGDFIRTEVTIICSSFLMTILGLWDNGTCHFRIPCSTTPISLEHVQYEDSFVPHMCKQSWGQVFLSLQPWLSHLIRAQCCQHQPASWLTFRLVVRLLSQRLAIPVEESSDQCGRLYCIMTLIPTHVLQLPRSTWCGLDCCAVGPCNRIRTILTKCI